MPGIFARLKHSWNAFIATEQKPPVYQDLGPSYSGRSRPERTRMRVSNERSIISSIYTRLGIDVAAVEIRHVKVDDDGHYLSDMPSSLNDCLSVEANIDQGARAFRQDMAMTLFDKGVIAIVPVDTTMDPLRTGGYDIQSLRVGEVIQWFPRYVQVRVYNDHTDKGIREDIILPKSMVAIVENPFYSVMNEPNSTLRRLIHKLNLLDAVDEQSASGNLDLIIQLPYVIKTEARRAEAEKRRKEIEVQLKGSQYGIAYTDGTEKVTQLNRPAENNLWTQVTELTNMLYTQLGLTPEIMNGSANEQAVINYYNSTIEPILAAITDGLKRTFLTKTARTQGQSIQYFRDPFRSVTIADLASMADAFSRNEILTPNDIRAIVRYKPSSDPSANQLKNRNMPNPGAGQPPSPPDPVSAIKPEPQPVGVSQDGAGT